MDSYDEIPYQSTPFPETHPMNLAVLGRLFGIETPEPARCRVLELGCAAGGNLIPIAWQLPGAECVGIELSRRQTEDGQRMIHDAGLRNVTIAQGDILELDTSLGRFDYIITHGVYSWVPPAVREKLLSLCAELLTPNGIAYVSYNTLPGWRLRGMLRDMLLEHTRHVTGPRAKLAAAHELLAFMAEGVKDLDVLSARLLRFEVDYLRNAHPSYLYHEYLEAVNEPFWLRQFVGDANRHGLRYVCDTDLHTRYPSTLGDHIEALFETIEDPIEREQRLDYLRVRGFRQSLLTHAGTAVRRDPALPVFETLAFAADLTPPKSLDLRRAKAQSFTKQDGTPVPASHPLTKAALAELHRMFPDSVAYADLLAAAQAAVTKGGGAAYAQQGEHLSGELFSLYAHRHLGADLAPRTLRSPPSDPPRATALARLQAAAGQVATVRHATMDLDAFGQALLGRLDGSREVAQLAAELTEALQSGVLPPPGPLDKNPEKLRQQVLANTQRLLGLFERHGLLAHA